MSDCRQPALLQQLDHFRDSPPEEWRKRGDAGRVGYGLFADESIHAGEYILEYVGEIIDLGEFNMRKHG